MCFDTWKKALTFLLPSSGHHHRNSLQYRIKSDMAIEREKERRWLITSQKKIILWIEREMMLVVISMYANEMHFIFIFPPSDYSFPTMQPKLVTIVGNSATIWLFKFWSYNFEIKLFQLLLVWSGLHLFSKVFLKNNNANLIFMVFLFLPPSLPFPGKQFLPDYGKLAHAALLCRSRMVAKAGRAFFYRWPCFFSWGRIEGGGRND